MKIPENKQLAAIAWRRSSMTWREIGKRLGVDKDRLRAEISRKGFGDGWGDTPMKPVGAGKIKPGTNEER